MSGFSFAKRGEKLLPEHRLGIRERLRTYSVARRAWIEHGDGLLAVSSDQQQAIIRSVVDDGASLDIATILLILKICIQLWMWWNSEKISEPPMRAGKHESTIIAEGDAN